MIHEECGVFGIWQPQSGPVAHSVYAGLFSLQHRGQEAAGIAVSERGVFRHHKDVGLVSEVFSEETLRRLGQGNIAVGHVRYSTSGSPDRRNAQPVVVQHRKGSMALCHNGNLVNSGQLREKLELEGCIFHTTSDTEVISYLVTRERLHCGSIEEALERTMDVIDGAYSLVLMSPAKLIAARDPHGFRPLCIGRLPDGGIVAASESCALDAVGAHLERDLEPGEIVVIGREGIRSVRSHCRKKERTLCVFEYIYFARPDSVIDGCPVHEARRRAGTFLARSHPVEADVVIGVPDSGLDAAVGFAEESGIPYDLGLVKNKYIGRTFIAPSQEQRERMVRLKLNPIRHVVEGRRVVLIDDSIVRGTTSAQLIRLVRDAGAKEVHMRVSAPPFLHPCYYGTDIDSEENLIAASHTVEETAALIGADSLGYLSIEDACRLPLHTNTAGKSQGISTGISTGITVGGIGAAEAGTVGTGIETGAGGTGLEEISAGGGCGLCTACFGGRYPTMVPPAGGKNRFEQPIME